LYILFIAGSRRAPRTTLIIVGVVSGVVLLAVIGAAAYAFCKGWVWSCLLLNRRFLLQNPLNMNT